MWYEYGNVFDILRQAGVRTAWLSNQEASGFYGSIGRTLGGRCDVMQFTSHLSHSIDLSERYDEELLPLLDGVLAEQPEGGAPQFLMLHLMGAHEEFGRRYPAPSRGRAGQRPRCRRRRCAGALRYAAPAAAVRPATAVLPCRWWWY